jgi:PAS domain S-box-containing protein
MIEDTKEESLSRSHIEVDPTVTYIAEISSDPEVDRAILAELAEPVIAIDGQGRIIRVNREAEIITCYTKLDLLGRMVEVLVPEMKRTIHVKHRERYETYPVTRQMGAHLNLDLIMVTREGKEIPVKISLKPLTVSRGRLFSVVIRLKDEVR